MQEKFKIVSSVPRGFVIWNIGHNAPRGYVVVARRISNNPNVPEYYYIDIDSVRMIKHEHAEDIMKAGSFAVSVEDAEKFIKKHQVENDYYGTAARLLITVLPYMREIFEGC